MIENQTQCADQHLVETFNVNAANPKEAIGSRKIPMHLWPEIASAMGALGLLDGLGKYGRGNYRGTDVRASIYYDALRRHMAAWFEGEDSDPDSMLPHFCHALACIAILIDAQISGTLVDDRHFPYKKKSYRESINALTPLVKSLHELHAGKKPKHYTIIDSKEEAK